MKERLIMKKIIFPVIALCLSAQVMAEESGKPLLSKDKLSIGAGISANSIDLPSSDKTGFQFFAAYAIDQINLMEGVNTSVELGYMDYGFSGKYSGGLWATGVIDGAISNGFGWLARLGLDLGDDSGLMFGAGVSYDLNKQMELRGEYIIRDDIDSIQVNFVYKL